MKNSILNKIYEFVKRILNPSKLIEEHSVVENNVIGKLGRNKLKNELNIEDIEILNEKIYKNIEYETKMNNIINIIETEPRLINTLDNTKLEKIKDFYKKRNQELIVKINSLKKSNIY